MEKLAKAATNFIKVSTVILIALACIIIPHGSRRWVKAQIVKSGTAKYLLAYSNPNIFNTWTVAPSLANAWTKLKSDFVGDGVNDQTAINSAYTSSIGSPYGYNAKVILEPGIYTLSDKININCAVNGPVVVEAQGTTINGPGFGATGAANTKDTIFIQDCTVSRFDWGVVKSSGTNAQNAIHLVGFIQSVLTHQGIQCRSSHQGDGIYVDATSEGSSVDQITGTDIDGCNNGIEIFDTTTEDTLRVTEDYIFNNNVDIYEHGGAQPVANWWNVNLDCTWNCAAICMRTNSAYDVENIIMGVTPGCPGVQYDSGANQNILNETPQYQVYQASGVVDNSANVTAETQNLLAVFRSSCTFSGTLSATWTAASLGAGIAGSTVTLTSPLPGNYLIGFTGAISDSSIAANMGLGLYMDGAQQVSTAQQEFVAANIVPVSFSFPLQAVTAGTHNFYLSASTSAGTGSFAGGSTNKVWACRTK